MSTMPDAQDESPRLKRALRALQKLQAELDALESERREPLAIVGIGCRVPGADTPEQFWTLLRDGRDAIREVPRTRWDVAQYYDPDPRASGKITSPYGEFVDDVDRFDAPFFGIAPREAASLDPQQRLLLEVSWEALEHAGIAPDSLAGSPTGVFVGISSNDFAQIVMAGDAGEIDHYMGSGNARSVAAGRLSYVLGLKGPSLSIDTACSSSLVAVHLACESLRRRECELALAGGVNLLFSPEVSVSHSRAQMLAPDGRCKTFDASADGFVRAEGCGVVVLKRLSSAITDHDNVLAVVLGSAINHDGRTSALTVPSGPSQESVIRAALTDAGTKPSSVSYVEAHGTGTRLGDPIEVGALAAVLCEGRATDDPLVLGSVKTNIGHLEGAAGIAGLLKVVLACTHQEIPAHLHIRELNPLIPWQDLPIRVATTPVPWQPPGRPRTAGVSSFGFSGTNAHVVVADAPPEARHASTATFEPSESLLVLSAKTDAALRKLASRYSDHFVAHPSIALADVAFSAATGRAQFAHRLAVAAPSATSCREQLQGWLRGETPAGLACGHVLTGEHPQVAFLFSGQGSQYPGMAAALYQENTAFRASVERCETILSNWIDRPLTDLLFRTPAEILNETKYTQPALFALEYALAELWRSWGVEPDVLIGHSLGEYVAACVAGVFSIEDGLMLIARRAQLMQSVTGSGAMVAALTDEAQVTRLLGADAGGVNIAAINGPRNVVVSGARDRVDKVVEQLNGSGVQTVPLAVSHAFHSPQMDAILSAFGDVAARVRYFPPTIDIVSNLTGAVAGDEIRTAEYWCRHVRNTVRFAAGVRTLERLGCDTCIEVGPKPVLLDLARQTFAPGTGTWLPSLKPGLSDGQQLLRSLGTLYTKGAPIEWRRVYADARRNRIALPLYPFERQRCWPAPATGKRSTPAAPEQPAGTSHPLLGSRRWVAGTDDIRYEARIAADSPRYLADHQVFDTAILPASAFIEMALAAGVAWFDAQALTLQHVNFLRALRLDEPKLVQLVLSPQPDAVIAFQIYSRSEVNVDAPTTLHATGEIRRAAGDLADRASALARYRAESSEEVSLEWLTAEFSRRGVQFGPAFRGIAQLWRGPERVLARIEPPDAIEEELARYQIHPALLDACCRASGVFTLEQSRDDALLQVAIERLHYHQPPGGRLWASATVRAADHRGRDEWVADCEVFDETGICCLVIEGQAARRAARELFDPAPDRHGVHQYELQWVCGRSGTSRASQTLPLLHAIADATRSEIDAVSAHPELVDYGRFLLDLDQLARVYVLSAFAEMGWTWRFGERFATRHLAETLSVVDRHLRLFERLLEMLAEGGSLRRIGEHWEVAAANWTPPDELRATLSVRFPEGGPEISLVRDSGEQLAGILRGTVDPLEFLFPKGDVARIGALYENTRGAIATHAVLRKAVAKTLDACAGHTAVRVLEIGAGTGAATASLLDLFDPRRTRYTISDVSPRFLTHAQARFAQHAFVEYRVLDIEQPLADQGFESNTFDLVIAANVLHATRHLGETIGHVRELLAPGGVLIALEGTAPSPWLDLVFGLLAGWWRFADADLRPSHPLISAEAWERLLAGHGFSQPVAVSAPGIGALARQAAIVAQKPHVSSTMSGASGTWLILADQGGTGAGIAELLTAAGHSCHVLDTIDRLPSIIGDFARTQTALTGIVYLRSLDAARADDLSLADLQRTTVEDSATVLKLLHAVIDPEVRHVTRGARVWLVTRDAQAAGSAAMLSGIASAPLWGLGKVLALEYPEHLGGMLDLAPGQAAADAATVVQELLDGDGEDLVAFRDGERLVARLEHRVRRPGRPVAIRADATYLVTGGLGGLGIEIVTWLVRQGARHVCVTGRSARTSQRARDSVRQWQDAGAEVDVIQADISDPVDARRLFDALAQRPPLRGVVHTAGIPASGSLDRLDPATLAKAFAAKISGTWLLHALTQQERLDFFVLCSSMVAVWGATGQGDYVAANTFLDAYAHYRRALNLPALSIDWGPLEGGGMLPSDSVAGLARMGIGTRPIAQAGDVFGDLLQTDAAQIVVADIDWRLFRSVYEVRARRPLFEDLQAAPVPDATRRSARPNPLAGVAATEREATLRDLVQRTLAEVLGLTTAHISDPRMGFFDLGMDSLTAMEFRDRLEASLGIALPATVALDYSTVETLAAHLLVTIGGDDPAPPTPESIDPEPVDDAVRRLQELSEEEVEALLLKKLETL